MPSVGSLLGGVLLALGGAQAQSVIYVDDDAPLGGDGTRWATAFPYLQDALAEAAAGDEIRVAGGTYKPDKSETGQATPGNRSAAFVLLKDVVLKGGFAGLALPGNPDVRDIDTYESILSGDLNEDDVADRESFLRCFSGDSLPHRPECVVFDADGDGDVDAEDGHIGENSGTVVKSAGMGPTTIMDGFTVTGGNADTSPSRHGGGMSNWFGRPTVVNCTFSGNAALYKGGGMHNEESSPTVINCVFSGNLAGQTGGGMHNFKSRVRLTSCAFNGNSAGDQGGAMYNSNCSATVTNCTFVGNSADYGGAMYSFYNYYYTSPIVTNCTFSGNRAREYGGGLFNAQSDPQVRNCIFWGNTDVRGAGRQLAQMYNHDREARVTYSCVQDTNPDDGHVFPGSGNIDDNPALTDPDGPDGVPGTGDEDMHLSPRSPCIDAADNTIVPADRDDLDGDGDIEEPLPVDIRGLPRFHDDPCMPDIGNPDPELPGLGIADMGAFEYQDEPVDDADGDGMTGCADNCPLQSNPGQVDCDGDGFGDVCGLELGPSRDCNLNDIPDECDIADGTALDDDRNGLPDECETVYFVDDDAPPDGDGTSWETAFRYLQDALAVVKSTDEVRVAEGVYLPDRDEGGFVRAGDPNATFELYDGVELKGGYAGLTHPDDSDERDPSLYESILTGDLNGDDDSGGDNRENTYRVVTASRTDAGAILDGFTITAGNSNWQGGGLYSYFGSPRVANCTFRGNSADSSGGGMYSSGDPTVVNCTFSGNSTRGRGGGMQSSGESATLINCTFNANSAGAGGGMYNTGDPTVVNCTFAGNSADNGGGMSNGYGADPTLAGCTFSGNSARNGGGMRNDESNPTLTNCTFSENSADEYGGGIFNSSSNPTAINCIFWGNADAFGSDHASAQILNETDSEPVVGYSCVQDDDSGDNSVYPGLGNIDDNPAFVDSEGPDGIAGTGDENLRLLPRSPCIDAADNTSVPADRNDLDDDGDTDEVLPVDLRGLPRFHDDPCMPDVGNPDPEFPGLAIVDMGSFEYQDEPAADPDGDGATGCSDNCPLHSNPGQADCDLDGFGDLCRLALGLSPDCNGNDIPDECDLTDGTSDDLDDNGVPDECRRVHLVDDDAPLGGDGTIWKTAFKHLQDALTAAAIGDEIHVAGGTYKPDQDEGGLVVPGDRTATFLLLNEVELTGGYAGLANLDNPDVRDFDLYESTLSGDLAGDDDSGGDNSENSHHLVTGSYTDETAVIDGFSITAGNANGTDPHDAGGGMYIRDGGPTLAACTFHGNSANRGGGVYNDRGGSPTLTDCTLRGNSATQIGGGMCNDESNATLTNCTFSENIVLRDDGGGMHNEASTVSVIKCAFDGNTADENGGGMYNSNSDVAVTDCTFSENFTTRGSGAGIYHTGGSATVANCTFSGNSADHIGGGMSASGDSVMVTQCTFNENVGESFGGGAYLGENVTVAGCEFNRNSAKWGGGMYTNGAPTVTDTTFSQNRTTYATGGGLYGGSPTLIRCTFTGNSAWLDNGGGMYTSGDPNLTDCTFSGNRARRGAAMYLLSSEATLTSCTFTNNTAELQGGAMFNTSGAPTITGCEFSGNRADYEYGGHGGGMYNERSAPTVTDCIFRANTATGSGGGMFNTLDSSPIIANCTFGGNVAGDGSGGGMYVRGGVPVITDSTFSSNRASNIGGGMYAVAGNPTVANCTFTLNLAALGGGMGDASDKASVTSCVFNENSADDAGGGMYLFSSNMEVTDCAFSENAADNSGGGMFNTDDSNAIVTYCTFSGNSSRDGGGVKNDGSGPVFANCLFSGNSALFGGALFNAANSDPTLANCTLNGNSAIHGGGMTNQDASPTVIGCVFSGNSASDSGGGMYSAFSGDVTVVNCTFSRNFAEFGGGMTNDNNSPTLTNCVLWDNADVRGTYLTEAQIHNLGDAAPVVTYSCVRDAALNDGNVFPGLGNIDANPILTDPDGPDGVPGTGDEDLRLLPRSPCIDAGDNTSLPPDDYDMDSDGDTSEPLPFDLRKWPRFSDDLCMPDVGSPDPGWPALGTVDMGALEYQDEPAGDPDGDGATGCADNCPLHANPRQANCHGRGLGDVCRFALSESRDCNGNDMPDECDLASGAWDDGDGNGVPDQCQTIHFVDDDAAPGGDGESWTTAHTYLQDALAAAYMGDEIHVAGGIYRPDRDEAGRVTQGTRAETFRLLNGVVLLGGFAGLANPNHPNVRDTATYASILSGDLNADDDTNGNEENSFHVVTGSQVLGSAVIDGFTIAAGNADGDGHAHGGGMYNHGGSPTVRNCVLNGNMAAQRGGGIYNYAGNALIVACTLQANSAANGAGMANDRLSGPRVQSCNFVGNTAGKAGAGMANYESDSIVSHCTLQENSAHYGGGMYNNIGRPIITDSVFTRNAAVRWGGGMLNQTSDPIVTGCSFTENSAQAGGGGIYNSNSNPTISGCLCRANSTEDFGGGIFNAESNPTVIACTLKDNSAVVRGGGMHNWISAPLVTHCLFYGNFADHGGGMSNILSDPTVSNTIFSGNSASASGGAMHFFNDNTPVIINCAFAGNHAPLGTSATCDSQQNRSYVRLSNTIVWDSEDGIWNNDFSLISIRHSAIWGGWIGEGNLNLDPLFVRAPDDGGDGWGDDPATPGIDEGLNDDYGNLRLTSDSPCANAGDPAFVPEPGETDLDGRARVLCGRVDMGAYEFGIGDFDCNDAIELLDFATWAACMTGPDGGPYLDGCEAFDFEYDRDVDLSDYAGFATLLAR